MADHEVPSSERVALKDAATRRALGIYAAKSFGWLVSTVALTLLGSLLLNDEGDAKPGVPDFVPFVPIMGAIFAALLTVFCFLRLGQMTWCAARFPWRMVSAQFEEIEMSTPNGQPILHLSDGLDRWSLTLGAWKWRWPRFAHRPQLLVAAQRKRGGLVATPDRRELAWAGRSAYTAYLLWRRRVSGR